MGTLEQKWKNQKSSYVIKTMSKAKFNKLTAAEKRVVVAQDVLDRIELGQIKPKDGVFCDPLRYDHDLKIKEQLESPKIECEACAKGSLFLAYIGIANNYDGKVQHLNGDEKIDSQPMQALSEIFSKKQLAYIETAFERHYYEWNVELSQKEQDMCVKFNDVVPVPLDFDYDREAEKKMRRICNNIIKNKGTFCPNKK
jgi:hypothetical protein